MFNDRFAVFFSMVLIVLFLTSCIIDVTGLYPLMSNLAIQLLLVFAFGILVLNTFLAKNRVDKDNDDLIEKKMPDPEDESSEYRQI